MVGLLLLVPGALHVVKKRVGAPARFYGFLLGGLLLTLATFASIPFLDEAPTTRFALGAAVCLLPPLSAGYALQALTTASAIPWWIALPVLVISVIGTLFVFTAILVSGGGYIVG